MKITKLKRHPRLERVRLYVEDGKEPVAELSLELMAREGIGVGSALSEPRLESLVREDEGFRARDAALSLLSVRPRSRAELRRRLERKEFQEAVIERTLAAMEELGYLDDAVFAEAFVRDRVRLKPRGRFGLLRELRRKGVAEAIAREAIDAVLEAEEISEPELALEAAGKWARRNRTALGRASRDRDERRKVRNRLYGHLARRGFSPDAIRPAMDDVLPD